MTGEGVISPPKLPVRPSKTAAQRMQRSPATHPLSQPPVVALADKVAEQSRHSRAVSDDKRGVSKLRAADRHTQGGCLDRCIQQPGTKQPSCTRCACMRRCGRSLTLLGAEHVEVACGEEGQHVCQSQLTLKFEQAARHAPGPAPGCLTGGATRPAVPSILTTGHRLAGGAAGRNVGGALALRQGDALGVGVDLDGAAGGCKSSKGGR